MGSRVSAVGNERGVLAGLRQLRAPVVAINPDARPTDAEALRRHGVKTVVVSGVGHFLMMEDPDRFNRLLGEVIQTFRGYSPEAPKKEAHRRS
jgi:pimeloyl-ACP methyl ester carboxylesterase